MAGSWWCIRHSVAAALELALSALARQACAACWSINQSEPAVCPQQSQQWATKPMRVCIIKLLLLLAWHHCWLLFHMAGGFAVMHKMMEDMHDSNIHKDAVAHVNPTLYHKLFCGTVSVLLQLVDTVSKKIEVLHQSRSALLQCCNNMQLFIADSGRSAPVHQRCKQTAATATNSSSAAGTTVEYTYAHVLYNSFCCMHTKFVPSARGAHGVHCSNVATTCS